tara:strand:+ start:1914 stop:2177 length:264 start_codon:yes stop_codon:yes gene_type:complete
MNEKQSFGELHSDKFKVGDIVEWTTWDSEEEMWESNYGVLLSVENKIMSNRIISISRVMPMNAPQIEMEFFTMSLKPISQQQIIKEE